MYTMHIEVEEQGGGWCGGATRQHNPAIQLLLLPQAKFAHGNRLNTQHFVIQHEKKF